MYLHLILPFQRYEESDTSCPSGRRPGPETCQVDTNINTKQYIHAHDTVIYLNTQLTILPGLCKADLMSVHAIYFFIEAGSLSATDIMQIFSSKYLLIDLRFSICVSYALA